MSGKPTIPRVCRQCGESFLAYASTVRAGHGHYCSYRCAGKNIPHKRRPLVDLFWEKVVKTDTCWNWTAAHHPFGYGKLGQRMAHRLAWELAYGPIPDGLIVMHRCDNPSCVRPDHLQLGTFADNTHDMQAKGRGIAGDKHPARTRPEYLPRGDKHPARANPGYLPKGENHVNAKLTEHAVRDIRHRHSLGGTSQRRLAIEYGVSPRTIGNVIHGLIWKHVR